MANPAIIEVTRGGTAKYIATVPQDWDLNLYTISSQIKDGHGQGAVVANWTVTKFPETKQFQLSLTSSQTLALPLTNDLYCDVRFDNGTDVDYSQPIFVQVSSGITGVD